MRFRRGVGLFFLSKIGSLTPSFCLIIYSSFSFLSPSQLLLMAFSSTCLLLTRSFPYLLLLIFSPIQSLVNISLLFIFSFPLSNPHTSSLLLHSYKPLITLRLLPPNSVIVRTSESYDFLCSYLFVLLENLRVSFISFVALTLPLCKDQVDISLLLLFALQDVGFVLGMFGKFKYYLVLLAFFKKQNKIKEY